MLTKCLNSYCSDVSLDGILVETILHLFEYFTGLIKVKNRFLSFSIPHGEKDIYKEIPFNMSFHYSILVFKRIY